ncbi:MAG TPA: hypothetical protein VM260_19265 [Pirellula sp.]|nr:hypothetical protein [Pirellula sp.]
MDEALAKRSTDAGSCETVPDDDLRLRAVDVRSGVVRSTVAGSSDRVLEAEYSMTIAF